MTTATTDILEQRSRRDARHERLFRWLLKACALLVLASLLGAAAATLWGGRDAFATFGWHFLVSSEWDPGNEVYGALVPVYGTLATSFIALLIAVPISFGWKAAGWLAQTLRARQALAQVIDAHALLQFGGASGTLAALGPAADAVAQGLATHLALPRAPISWHGARDGYARIGAELAVACGGAARIGRDVSLLMQPEVAEAFEPAGEGRGGSSAMPHKRNPVGSMLALEAAYRAPGLAATLLAELASEHERGLGTWQHSAFVLSDLFDAAGSALEAITEVIEGLRLDAAAMRANLDARQGFVFAEALTMRLAETLGKATAQRRVEALCRQALDRGVSLAQALADDAELTAGPDAHRLADVFDANAQLAGADAMIDAVLAQWRAAS